MMNISLQPLKDDGFPRELWFCGTAPPPPTPVQFVKLPVCLTKK